MNTSVLLSSIFFMALSVVSGCLMMLYWSSLGRLGMLLRGYLGRRMRLRVLGRWKWTVVRTLVLSLVWTPFRTAFFAFSASALALEALAVETGLPGGGEKGRLSTWRDGGRCRLTRLRLLRRFILRRHVLRLAVGTNAHALCTRWEELIMWGRYPHHLQRVHDARRIQPAKFSGEVTEEKWNPLLGRRAAGAGGGAFPG